MQRKAIRMDNITDLFDYVAGRSSDCLFKVPKEKPLV